MRLSSAPLLPGDLLQGRQGFFQECPVSAHPLAAKSCLDRKSVV